MSAGQERAQATFWLLDAPDSLAAQSHREPDGTGLGSFDEQERPHVTKQPIAAFSDREFARGARELRSHTFIAHIRYASTGSLSLENTHPFEQDGRLFAHNGVIEDLDALDARLGPARSLVQGDTDSERFFALITKETAAAGGDVEAGIAAACRWIAATLPLFAINFVLVSSRELWALRYPETHELHLLRHRAGEALHHESSFGTRVSSEHGRSRSLVVLASERMDDDPAWQELESGRLVHVDGKLRVSSRQLLEAPPAHLLTLADLDARARSSQAKVPAAGA